MSDKINCFILAILTIGLLPSLRLAKADSQADAIIKELLKKYEASKNVKVDFQQKFIWKLTDNISELKGTIWLEGKDKFKILTDDQTIVSDGKTLWTYSKTNHQVIIDQVAQAEDINLPRDILLSFSDQYDSHYLKKEKIDNKQYHLIELTAKVDELFIRQIKIWIEVRDLILAKIEQIDLNENVNEYLLTNLELKANLPANFFKFEIPDTIEVIDMR